MKRSLALLVATPLLVASFVAPVHASGGEVKRKTDGIPDGYYYNALGSAAARYGGRYDAGEFDINAIICGTRYRDLDQSIITPGIDDYVLVPDLRFTDVNCAGYADLGSGGLIANADANSFGSCSTTGAPRTATYGGGAGTPDPLTAFLITLVQPANNDANEGIDFCGILLDTSSLFVNSARTQGVAPGGPKTTIGFNHFVEAIVFEPREFDLNIRMSGSSRFPGDQGIPVVFARRKCNPVLAACSRDNSDTGNVATTDDYITAALTIDNNTLAPRALNLHIEADRAAINPKLGKKDITPLFRPVGGGPPLTNPITFPSGRSRFNLEVKTTIRRKFLPLFPADLPFCVRLQDPNDANDIPDQEAQELGLRPTVGYYDGDTHAGGFFFTQSPVVTGDSMNVNFTALDGPKQDDTRVDEVDIHGAEVVGGEFGSSGLPGLDAFQVRLEDPVLRDGNPDLSPQGLLRSVGTKGDPGNADGIPMGLPPTTVLIDFTNLVINPRDPRLYSNLIGMALLNPGDAGAGVTAIGASNNPDVLVGNSSILGACRNPVTPLFQNDLEIRLDYDGELGNSLQTTRRTGVGGGSLQEFGKIRVATRSMRR